MELHEGARPGEVRVLFAHVARGPRQAIPDEEILAKAGHGIRSGRAGALRGDLVDA